ncbi:hypothetical protein RSW79_25425, partial [Escherichia coli]|nr:hypothetical protein [Escherichia coli]
MSDDVPQAFQWLPAGRVVVKFPPYPEKPTPLSLLLKAETFATTLLALIQSHWFGCYQITTNMPL